MIQLRVFLSSPGDLGAERAAVRAVVQQVQGSEPWKGRVHIDLVAWDDPLAGVPMDAGLTPQASVNKYAGLPRDCDLTVVLLWNRIGTPLPADQRRADGTPFESGTVWEMEDALAAGPPRPVWLYRCRRNLAIADDADEAEVARSLAQRAAVRKFIERFRNPDGSLAGGVTEFEAADEFSRLFGQHLNAELRRLEQAQAGPAKAPPGASADGLAALQPWDFSAYLASKRARFTGRDWLFADIAKWLDGAAPRALLVRADYGVGKSALMAEFIHRDGQRAPALRRVVGWHFCQHDTRQTLRPGMLVASLAAQLAAHIPAYARFLAEHPDLVAQLGRAAEDPGSVFEAAVLNPLQAIPQPAQHPLLILVDALDESLELEPEGSAAPAGGLRAALVVGSIVALLAAKVGRLPPWLRLLATTRNNPAVIGRLKGAFGVKELDAEAGLNREDIAAYAQLRLSQAPLSGHLGAAGMNAAHAAKSLCDKSGGKFLYAVRVLDDLFNGVITPAEMLNLPPGMDGFYLDSFERRFGAGGRNYEPARALLAVMAAAREPLAPHDLAEVLANADPAVASEPALKALRAEAFSDFIRVREGRWSFDHFSLREWLTREDEEGNPRAGPYTLVQSPGQGPLADWCTRRFDAWAGTPAGDAAREACPDHVLRHLCAYLLASGRRAACRARLFKLPWLGAKIAGLNTLALLSDFEATGDDAELRLLGQTLAMCGHILDREPQQLVSQLLGRLPRGHGPALDALLEDCGQGPGRPWLMPRVPSLQPPGHPLRVLEGHADAVYMAEFSPDGEFIASASADGTVRLWRRDGQPLAELVGHEGAVNQVNISTDAQWIASAGEDQKVRLWQRSGELAASFACGAPVLSVEFEPGGQRLLVGLRQRRALLVDREGRTLATLEGHQRALSSARFGWLNGVLHIVTASNDGTARLWSAAGEPLAILEGHEQGLTGAWIVPGPAGSATAGPIAGAAGADLACVLTTSLDHRLRLWRADGTPLAVCSGHAAPINSASVSPDGKRLLTASNDNTARLWSRDGSELAVLHGHRGWVTRAVFSPDGQFIATSACDNTLRLWLGDGRPLAELRGHADWVLHVVFSADGSQLISAARDNTARLWRTQAVALPERPAHRSEVTRLALSPGGGRLASASTDNEARLWSAEGQALAALQGHGDWVTALAFSPKDDALLSASCDGTLRWWSREGLAIDQLQAHAASINDAALAPDGHAMASAANDGEAALWVRDGAAPTGAWQRLPLDGHDDAVNRLAFSPDGQRLVTASNDGTARLWNRSGDAGAVLRGPGAWVLQAAFAPDGESVLAALVDGSLRRWALDGQALASLWPGGATLEHLEVDTRSGTVAAGARDGRVLFSPNATGPLAEAWRHTTAVSALTLAASNSAGPLLLASGCEDGEVRVAHWRGGAFVDPVTLDLDAPVRALLFGHLPGADGAAPVVRLFAADALGHVHFLELR